MKQVRLLLLIIVSANIFAACKKDKTEPTELSKLPAATQTGANTFGCLVNGKAWVANNGCRYLCTPPFLLNYSASNGGMISMSAELVTSNYSTQRISIFLDSTNYKTQFNGINKNHVSFSFSNNNIPSPPCRSIFSTDSNTNVLGNIRFTKYDLSNKIISGTFEFTLSVQGCETIIITEARFDKKLY
jgi:hypothetical protein